MKKFIYFLLINLLFNINSYSQTRYIRTVVHVMYTDASNNITDFQVTELINNVNKGFSKNMLEKFTRTPDIFSDDWENTDIQFCLAKLDENNNLTSGITHNPIDYPESPLAIPNVNYVHWDPSEYFNIYITPVYAEPGTNFILGGWASTPYDAITPDFSSVVVASQYINSFLAEILCHEIGHVFGLAHLDDDTCEDTPAGIEAINPFDHPYSTVCDINLQNANTTDLITDGNHWGGVNPPNLIENFMGLSFCCSFMFTSDQSAIMNASINSHFSNWIELLCQNSNEITNLNQSEDYSIFPNPVNDVLNVSSKNQEGFNLQIFNSYSELVYSTEKSLIEVNINVKDFPKGVYFLKISIEDLSKFSVSKFVVQ